MQISFDPDKRERTLRERGIDFADAAIVFAGQVVTVDDDRRDYGERRFLTFGWIGKRAAAVIWTERDDGIRIISMRYAHAKEIRRVGLD